jgi:DNA-binding transcriptional LysR family regulator
MAVLSAIVETGSFARAAATLGITASAARSSISRLELRLGVKLLERTGSAPHLTQAGEVFHAHCLRILRAARDAHAAVATESYGLPTAS